VAGHLHLALHGGLALGVQAQQGAQVTLLPEPDSPISATASPGRTDRLTPLTACTGFGRR
jgi:hypothetical protein